MAIVLDGTLGLTYTGDTAASNNLAVPGNVGVGTSSPVSNTNQKSVTINGTSFSRVDFQVGGSSTAYIYSGLSNTNLGTIGATAIAFDTNSTERMRIDTSGRFTLASQPFFYATLTVAQTGYNSASTGDVVVIYNSTTTNTGSHYNTATGKFTAPVAGNYIFHASAYASGSSFQQNWLVVNGSRITGTDWVHASSTMSLGFWLIKLAANDTVGFHAYNGGVTSTTINTNSEHTYFRGYLLS